MNDTSRLSQQLLPCPFCGGKAHLFEDTLFQSPWVWVECLACAAQTGQNATPQAAIEAWNRRQPQ